MGMAKGRSLQTLTLSCSRNIAASKEAASGNLKVIMRTAQIGTISVAPLWGADSKPRPMGADSLRVPGMHTIWEGESSSRNLMEVKRREAQGRHREVGSEGSVEQNRDLTNRNRI